jgi:hypothetical protein
MATIKPLDNAFSIVTRTVIPEPARQLIQWSLDARRAIILGKRALGGELIGVNAPDTVKQPKFEEVQNTLKAKRQSVVLPPDISQHSFKTPIGAKRVDDYVAIIDIDYYGFNKGHRVIKLPFIPRELNYNSESSFAAIKPIGRNNPKYHYTGSEDKLDFEIDWHSFNTTRDDVITKCRMIEALSKSDSYKNPPHRVLIQWGSDNVLFRDHVFVVLSAPYRLLNFNKAQVNQQTGEIERTGMLPVQAYQRVSLGRVTSTNLFQNEIEYVSNKLNTSNLSIPTLNNT